VLVYEGDKIGKTKKSMAFHMSYSSKNKTLKAGEVDEIHKKVVKMLRKDFDAEIR